MEPPERVVFLFYSPVYFSVRLRWYRLRFDAITERKFYYLPFPPRVGLFVSPPGTCTFSRRSYPHRLCALFVGRDPLLISPFIAMELRRCYHRVEMIRLVRSTPTPQGGKRFSMSIHLNGGESSRCLAYSNCCHFSL